MFQFGIAHLLFFLYFLQYHKLIVNYHSLYAFHICEFRIFIFVILEQIIQRENNSLVIDFPPSFSLMNFSPQFFYKNFKQRLNYKDLILCLGGKIYFRVLFTEVNPSS